MIEKMPSASTKTEKVQNNDASDPLRQAIVIIEHKIRNLEKRKSKLDSYKDSGKPLTREQNEAVSKYEEVTQQLELSKEYIKQFTVICTDTDKLRKKAAKKEALERTTTETFKIKQVLLIQDVLQNMGTDPARDDFLNGQNGAVKLSEVDMKCLDDLYLEVSPKHEGPQPFMIQAQKASEHLMTIIEGRSRELAGSTGAKIQGLINSIHTCGYFEQQETPEQPEDPPIPEPVPEEVEVPAQPEEMPPYIVEQVPVQPPKPANIPSAAGMHPIIQNIVPVSQVESTIFNAQGFQPPSDIPNVVQTNPAPLNDVMSRVGGNLTFFQESELDGAELGGVVIPAPLPQQPPNSIPTRTFTNQNFNGQPAQPPINYPPAPANNPYFVPGYQPQGAPHYTQEMIQGYPVVTGNGTLPATQSQPGPATEAPNRGFPQPPQHIGNAFVPQTNIQPSGPPASVPPPVNQNYHVEPIPTKVIEEPIIAAREEPKEEAPRQEWPTNDRLDWGSEEFAEWVPQGTNGNGNTGAARGRGDRNDRPRSNYQGNRNNRNNYNRSGNRDRDSGNNYNNNHQNGYQSRGGDYPQRDNKDRDYQPRENKDRDYQPRENKDRDYQPRGDREMNGSYGGYRRGPPPPARGPRPDRPPRHDRPPQNNSAPRNSGPRPPRNNYRGNNGNYPQEAQEAK